MRNIPEERKSHLHCGGSQRLRNIGLIDFTFSCMWDVGNGIVRISGKMTILSCIKAIKMLAENELTVIQVSDNVFQ